MKNVLSSIPFSISIEFLIFGFTLLLNDVDCPMYTCSSMVLCLGFYLLLDATE